ncbi:hypothetical protein KUTeg_017406 [Tegillarca granosa]|uniref:Uncharacterized protein n=1 Tax=Tegillarca granosa TaxID=220873 RepID=A0ABQ9EM91_TEGGR|nr:hypothetical protein KUTeg_017406 [Tegillarca granosa]
MLYLILYRVNSLLCILCRHGFGDCKKPLHDSALLVEEIVHQQMEVLVKLRRLLRYMDLKDMKSLALKGIDEEEAIEQGDKSGAPVKRRRKQCYDFLSSIDQTGELVALFDDDGTDEVKHERLLRAELLTRGMDPKQYLDYTEARQVNFSKKYKSLRFRDWLLTRINLEIKPNPHAMEIVSYLAYETVAQQDMRATATDPLAKNFPNICVNYYDQTPTGSASGVFARSIHAGLTSPTVSPPTTPTNTTVTQSNILSVDSTASNKSKAKKRKKSGHPSSVELSTAKAIKPSEIQEAMRRYGHCVGPFASQRNMNAVSPKSRLLCT